MSEINWTNLGAGLAFAFIAFMQVWTNWKNKRDVKKAEDAREALANKVTEIAHAGTVLADKVSEVAKTVDEVHVLTNGAMGLQKKTLAETTAAKAAITNNPVDVEQAKLAMNDYLEHVRKLAEVEAKATKPPNAVNTKVVDSVEGPVKVTSETSETTKVEPTKEP